MQQKAAPEARNSIFFRACRGGRPRAAVRDAGALRMRHTPCGCCPPAAPKARNASYSRARRVGADDPVRPTVPKARGCLSYSPKCLFCGDTATVAPRAYFFLSCQKKVCKKEALENEIALTRRKTSRHILRIIVTSAVKERPSGDRRIGSLERTIDHSYRYVSAR